MVYDSVRPQQFSEDVRMEVMLTLDRNEQNGLALLDHVGNGTLKVGEEARPAESPLRQLRRRLAARSEEELAAVAYGDRWRRPHTVLGEHWNGRKAGRPPSRLLINGAPVSRVQPGTGVCAGR